MLELMDMVLFTLLLSMLVFAVRSDLLEHRIPNALVVCIAAAGLLAESVKGGWGEMLAGLCGAAAGLAVLLPFYVLRGMSAGDVKLMGAVGAFVGPLLVLTAAAWTLIAGAVLALAYLAWRMVRQAEVPFAFAVCQPTLWRLTLSQMRRERFPYALAIAIGTLIACWQRDVLAFSP